VRDVRVMVWKKDLEKHRDISYALTQQSRNIEEQDLAYVYIPKNSYKQMTILLESRYISYGIISSEELHDLT
jgi:hypothetical protein